MVILGNMIKKLICDIFFFLFLWLLKIFIRMIYVKKVKIRFLSFRGRLKFVWFCKFNDEVYKWEFNI